MSIDLSPEQFRRLGYQAVDLIAYMLQNVEHAPVRQPVPAEQREAYINAPLPQTPVDPAELIDRFGQEIMPYPMGNNSPTFMGWVNSPPAPLALIADMLASALNAAVAGGDHMAVYVEHGVLNWMKDIMGYPRDAGAVLVSGGSVANLVCLGAMRHWATNSQDRAAGMMGQTPLVVYMSAQGHSCLQKAVEILGLGTNYLRRIPVDANFRMDLDALRKQIAEDRAAGLRPACVACSAGTVNTGAIDPLSALADLCEQENMWLHVDGAYGGVGILAEQTTGQYAGIERADSIAIDQHKWLYVPIECGCALVRDAELMRDSYSVMPSYLRDDRAMPWLSEYTIQQTRGFRALKLWMVIQQVGIEGYRKLISHDITMARTLVEKIRGRDDFEFVADGPLSIVCFRYKPAGLSEAEIDALNRALLPQLMFGGEAFVSGTELNGRPVLRACIVNFRTQPEHLDRMLQAVVHAAEKVPVQ